MKEPTMATVAELQRLATAAAEHVVGALATKGGSAGMTLGERGSTFCRKDMQAHVELPTVAVEYGGATAFRQHVQVAVPGLGVVKSTSVDVAAA